MGGKTKKKEHHTPPASRSPSAVTESVPAAGYREWPLQGFLKRTMIENETTCNLHFNLTHILEHLELSISSKAFGMSSSREKAIWFSNLSQRYRKFQDTPSSVGASDEAHVGIIRRCNADSDEKARLLVGRDPGCSPQPEQGGDPSALFDEA